jgi:hypothetical protein
MKGIVLPSSRVRARHVLHAQGFSRPALKNYSSQQFFDGPVVGRTAKQSSQCRAGQHRMKKSCHMLVSVSTQELALLPAHGEQNRVEDPAVKR